MFEANYGRKIYLEQIINTTSNYRDEQWGMGGYYDYNDGWGMGQMGMGSWINNSNQITSKPSSDQWIGKIRIAQSLGNSTGLSADFLLRRNPVNMARFLPGQVSVYITEEELFDDRYGYESEEIEILFTQYLPWKFILKSSPGFRWKNYSKHHALDKDGEILSDQKLRVDQQILFWINLNKSFSIFKGKEANIFFDFYWIKNQSNDFYYNYEVSLISMGLGLSF